MAERNIHYDRMAPIYDVWVRRAAAVTDQHPAFYADEYESASGPVVELGVGNGRIMIEAAKRGVAVIGVDSSPAMIELTRRCAEQAGVAARLSFIEADFRDFRLAEPAALIAIPFHTIGHMLSLDDKRDCFLHIHSQLRPGGRFIFDHFVFSEEIARANSNRPTLGAEFTHPETGRDALLWSINTYDMDAQTLRVIAWVDELCDDGVLARRTYIRMPLSWITPEQSRELLQEAGFEIDCVYGDFDRAPFAADSHEQIWFARRA